MRSQFDARVTANQPLCREHFRLLLTVADFPATSPGQFIQIAGGELRIDDVPQGELDWRLPSSPPIINRELAHPTAMLRRPFSLAGRTAVADGVSLEIIHRVVGVATEWFSHLKIGDTVSILGPLGNHFTLPAPDQPAFLVGGGVGIPPMLYLAEALKNHPAVAFCGVTTRDLLPLTLISDTRGDQPRLCINEFAVHGIPALISTDDGTLGRRGFVTAALEAHLDRVGGPSPIIYTCGPEPMMKRVAAIAMERGLECQVAVERAMACGMGTCQSCCIKVRASNRPDGRTWLYRLACTDGPVFPAAELLW